MKLQPRRRGEGSKTRIVAEPKSWSHKDVGSNMGWSSRLSGAPIAPRVCLACLVGLRLSADVADEMAYEMLRKQSCGCGEPINSLVLRPT